MTSTTLILVAYRNYNVLNPPVLKTIDWEKKPGNISKIWNFKFSILNSKLIFRIL